MVGAALSSTAAFVTTTRATPVVGRHLEHDRPEHLFHDRAEPAGAGLAQHGEVGDRLERLLVELELDAVELEHALVLPHERVLRLGEDLHERVAGRAA